MIEKSSIEADVLILGAGIAGCRAAIEAHDLGASVIMVTKGAFGRDAGATWMASLGYQCWGIYPHDTLDVQVEDTLRCGWFLNNQENVYAFLAHIPDTAMELLKWGGRYKMKDGRLEPRWQLGCSTKEGRSLIPAPHPRGHLGNQYYRIFPPLVRSRQITILEDMFIVDLLFNGDTVVGALGIDMRRGEFRILRAKATILATGGYQGLYTVTTANPNLTGDGQAIALRAGVDMMDFEFNQTLPSALWPPYISGNLMPFRVIIDWDGNMYNSDGERFMAKWDPVKMERSTRAIISRAIFHEIKKGKTSPHGGIYTGATHKPKSFVAAKIKEYEHNRMFMQLRDAGIDLSKDHIETGYAIHYCQGGCNVNVRCETDRPGLYAIGEAASGSKDGSDRMMSNALPYSMAMGIIAGREVAQRANAVEMPEIDHSQAEKIAQRALAPLERGDGIRVYQVRPELQGIMVKETGYGRTEEGLTFSLREIDRYKEEVVPRLCVPCKSKRLNMEWINVLEFQNLLLVAECIARNASLRRESRGLHDRWDNMEPHPDWYKNIHLRMVNGELQQWTTQVDFRYWKPEAESLGEPWYRGVKVKDCHGWRAEPVFKRM